jgi:flagellar protein FliO/FliZ
MTQSLVTVVLFVLAILSIPFLLRRWQDRRGGLAGGAAATGTGAKVLSAIAVGPQQRVVTIEIGPEGARIQLVLGVTAQSVTCLHTSGPPGPAVAATPASAFVSSSSHLPGPGRPHA